MPEIDLHADLQKLRAECDARLIATCRQLQTLLESAGHSPALRLTAPALYKALPLLATLAIGIEDLVNRVALLERMELSR